MNTAEEGVGPGVVLAGLPAGSAAADRYAARGYTVAVAALVASDDLDAGLEAVRAAMDALRAAGLRRIAVAGYEDGGRFAYLAVTRLGADAAVAFRATGLVGHLSEARNVRAPLSLHFGDDDARVPLADVRKIKGALEGFGTVEIYRYPAYDEHAARQAEQRACAVLDRLRDPAG